MKKKNYIIIITGVVFVLLIVTIAYFNKDDSVQRNEDNISLLSRDALIETSENSFKKDELNQKTLEPVSVISSIPSHIKSEKARKLYELSLSLASSDPKEIEEALHILAHQSAVDSGFSEEAARKILSGNPDDSLLPIDSLPEELQLTIKKELEQSKKNGYDDVSDQDAEGIINIINYIVDTSPLIPDIRFTPSQIPDIINFNYNYIGYSFPNTSVMGTASFGIQGTVRRVYQRLDESHILIVQESTLQSGSANLIEEFVNTQAFGYPAIYAIKKSSSGKKYAMLNWATKDFAYSLYQINSLENAQNILGAVGNSLTEVNLKKEMQIEEKEIIPAKEAAKVNEPL